MGGPAYFSDIFFFTLLGVNLGILDNFLKEVGIRNYLKYGI